MSSQPVNLEVRERQMRQLPNANRRLGEQVQRTLNKSKKPSTAEEITELLNRNLGRGDGPFPISKVTAWLRNAGDTVLNLYWLASRLRRSRSP